jgi:hypothetical protein
LRPRAAEKGEAYRESLVSRARGLGVHDHVAFLDQFVDQTTLLSFISMCDVYVTPYLDQNQMTSGTLAYSFGSGKAVVSTPYQHAAELLADGRGILIPFADAQAIGIEVAGLLTNDEKRNAMRRRAFASSRSMTWDRAAERYYTGFDHARGGERKPTVLKLHDSGVPQRGSSRHRTCGLNTFFRCATIPVFSSMPCIACRTGPMAIAWMTTHAHCSSRALLARPAKNSWTMLSRAVSRLLSKIRGITMQSVSETS